MKKILIGALAALISLSALATTTVSSTLINWVSAPSAPSQTAKFVFAAPNASAGLPVFRQLIASDIPTLAPLASPTFTGTVTTGALSATTIGASGAITPSQTAGIVGTTTNNNANAGSVGEYVSASATSVSLTSTVPLNVTSISLTAGDWEVSCDANFIPAASTVETQRQVGISTTSATIGALGTSTLMSHSITGLVTSVLTPVVRQSLSATTTVYCVGVATFTTSTDAVSGFIRARRVR